MAKCPVRPSCYRSPVRCTGSVLFHKMHKYRMIAKKGEGTFSEVLKAQCLKTSKYVAIKCMKNTFDNLDQRPTYGEAGFGIRADGYEYIRTYSRAADICLRGACQMLHVSAYQSHGPYAPKWHLSSRHKARKHSHHR